MKNYKLFFQTVNLYAKGWLEGYYPDYHFNWANIDCAKTDYSGTVHVIIDCKNEWGENDYVEIEPIMFDWVDYLMKQTAPEVIDLGRENGKTLRLQHEAEQKAKED